ncbi:MAG: ATP-binding protein [Candidatus Angelobacter sp.]
MISDERIRQLIALGSENRSLDYKAPFSWATLGKDEKHGIIKDVLAFSNTRDGGVILVGVDDKTGQHIGLAAEEAASFDQTKFNDLVHVYTDPRHTCNVYRRILDGKNIVAIEVPEFKDVPILCKQTAGSTVDPNKILLRKAALYIRTEKASSVMIETADDMRELINRALFRRQDDLLTAMNRIINPQKQPEAASDSTKYEREIFDTENFFTDHIGPPLKSLGHWAVTFQPEIYLPDRFADLLSVQKYVHQAQVTLRGWSFPHMIQENSSNFSRGFQCWVDRTGPMNRYLEAFRAYRSGLFHWKGALWEESARGYADSNILDWTGVILDFTEWLLFAQRYYEQFLEMSDRLNVKFVLSKAQGRTLVAPPDSMPLWDRFSSRENEIILQELLDVVELRVDAAAIARRFVRRTFEIFNWNNVDDATIASKQKQYMSGHF